MSVNSVYGSNSTAKLGSNQEDSVVNINLEEQDFLRLMVAQVQNQEPGKFQVNGKNLSQSTQFSTKDGVTKMLDSLKQLTSSLQSNQALQASALVGRKVLVNSDILKLGTEGDIKAAIDIPAGLGTLNASIYTESGEMVVTISLGQQAPGFFQFRWDGIGQNNQRCKAGHYKIVVCSINDGKEVLLKTMTAANVDSVSLGQNGEGLKLNVAGFGPVSLDKIRQMAL